MNVHAFMWNRKQVDCLENAQQISHCQTESESMANFDGLPIARAMRYSKGLFAGDSCMGIGRIQFGFGMGFFPLPGGVLHRKGFSASSSRSCGRLDCSRALQFEGPSPRSSGSSTERKDKSSMKSLVVYEAKEEFKRWKWSWLVGMGVPLNGRRTGQGVPAALANQNLLEVVVLVVVVLVFVVLGVVVAIVVIEVAVMAVG